MAVLRHSMRGHALRIDDDRAGLSSAPQLAVGLFIRMMLRPLIPFLAVALIASVTAMVYAAGNGDKDTTALATAAFVLLVLFTAAVFNIPCLLRGRQNTPTEVASTLRRNARLAVLVYCWGAAALFAVYSLTELSWQHAWQYAVGMLVIAGGILAYIVSLKKDQQPRLSLTVIHGLAATGGLTFLIGAGKMQTVRADWAANEVFLWGGISIVVLCLFSLLTQTCASPGDSPDTA